MADVHTNLAVALQNAGRASEAIEHYERALELEPNSAHALDNYGALLQKSGQRAAAIKLHERAIAVAPQMAQAYHNLGNALLMQKQPEAAIEQLKRAVELRPQFAEAWNCLGAAHHAIGKVDAAIEHLQNAVNINPNYAEAHANLGNALRDDGQMREAIDAFERAAELQPRDGRFRRLLIEARGNKASAAEVGYLERLLQEDAISVDDRIQLHFGLGHAYDTEEDIDRAFMHFRDGNALARSLITYDEVGHLQEMQLLMRLFNKTLVQALSGYGDPSDMPIFIFGMPRSGTTLVEQILAGHPQVCAGGEIGAMVDIMHHFPKIEADPSDVVAFREAFIMQLRNLGARYVGLLRTVSPAAARVTDKWPWTFKFIGLVHLILPNARLIHVRRSAADTCLSCFCTLFSDNLPYMYDQAEIGRYYSAYQAMMGFWRDALPAGRILELDYELLIDDFETQARRLVEHCGLDWDPACLEFWNVRRPVRTASSVAVRQPLQRRSRGRAEAYSAHLGPLLTVLEENLRTRTPTPGV